MWRKSEEVTFYLMSINDKVTSYLAQSGGKLLSNSSINDKFLPKLDL